MSELRNVLERASHALPASERDFEALHRRRDRRRRAKRITAGVVAVLVAAAGTATAFTAFGPPPAQQGVGPGEFFALWPDDTHAEAVAAQKRVESGGETWRLNYASVAERFGRRVLGWEGAWAAECRQNDVRVPCAENGDRVTLLLQQFHPMDLPTWSFPLRVHLARLVRPGEDGGWSVTKVDIQDVPLPFHPGQTIEVPRTVTISNIGRQEVFEPGGGPSESDWLVHVDFVEEGCPGSIGSAELRGRTLEFQLPGTPCPEPTRAVVALYRVADGQPEETISFEDPDGQQLAELAAVPVLFVQKDPEPSGSPCEAFEFRPQYLPWSGFDSHPEPRELTDDGNRILRWDGPDGRYVSVVRHDEPVGAGVDVDGSIRVMRYPAWLQWVGDPGVGELSLGWEAGPERCESYTLHLYDTSLSEEDARREILAVADSFIILDNENLTFTPSRGAVGDRIEFTGEGFEESFWTDDEEYGLALVRSVDGCEAIASTEHEISFGPGGSARGSFTVPSTANCFQSNEGRQVAVGPGMWNVIVSCHACIVDEFEVTG